MLLTDCEISSTYNYPENCVVVNSAAATVAAFAIADKKSYVPVFPLLNHNSLKMTQ